MLLNQNDIGGYVAKEDDRYIVKDNPFGNTLVISSTRLRGGQETTGHEHDGQEEVYFFIEGEGIIELDSLYTNVKAGDIVPIQDGVFHKVYNSSDDNDLYFICVFDGKRKV
tara:strand:- start:5673 stop:6005 length:333 start_codon:yes stop_codon:yes gene_type:complete